MNLSSEDLSRNDYFVSDTLSKCYYLFHLSRFPVSFFLFNIKITPNTNRKMSQAINHCLKYIFLPFLSESSRQGVGTGHASSNFAASHYES